MKLSSKLATAAAVLVAGLGVSASSASAYTMTTHLTGSSFSQHTITFDGAYTVSCDASLTGTSSGASIAFGFSYSGCTFFGFPADIYTSGSWGLLVTGGSAPNFTGQITVPSAAVMTLDIPIVGCEVYFTTPQTLSHGSGGNAITMTNVASPTSVDLEGSLKLPYTSNGGCMFSGSGVAEYETNGPVRIAGLTIDN
jgi:hypothetical protein